MLLKGIDDKYDWERIRTFITTGNKINFLKDTTSSELLLSKNISEKLNIKAGDKVILSFIRDNQQIKRRFQVCGIYNTGLEEYDKRFGLVDIRKLQEILTWPESDVQGMEIVLDDFRDMDVITDYILRNIAPAIFCKNLSDPNSHQF